MTNYSSGKSRGALGGLGSVMISRVVPAPLLSLSHSQLSFPPPSSSDTSVSLNRFSAVTWPPTSVHARLRNMGRTCNNASGHGGEETKRAEKPGKSSLCPQGHLILRCSESSGPKPHAIPAQPNGLGAGIHAAGGPKARSSILTHEFVPFIAMERAFSPS